MRFPGAESVRIDDAPTPSAFEPEMSSPLSKSREHRSRGPKPCDRAEASEEVDVRHVVLHQAETRFETSSTDSALGCDLVPEGPCLHPRRSRPTRMADLPRAEPALALLVVIGSTRGWNHPGP